MHASYLAGLASAVSDAQAKASALAAQVGDSLGAVENITEQSNDDGCSGVVFAAGTAKGAPVPVASPGTTSKKKSHGKPKPKAGTLERATAATLAIPAIARIADDSVTSCTIEADVTVTYAMAPA
jgi:hypothetical protein